MFGRKKKEKAKLAEQLEKSQENREGDELQDEIDGIEEGLKAYPEEQETYQKEQETHLEEREAYPEEQATHPKEQEAYPVEQINETGEEVEETDEGIEEEIEIDEEEWNTGYEPEELPENQIERQTEYQEEEQTKEKKGFFKRLVQGLSKTRESFVAGIDSVFRRHTKIDDDFFEEIEEILIMGDIGVSATDSILENFKEKIRENRIKDPSAAKELLINSIKEQMDVGETAYRFETETSVVLVIGVNGVGKTTSVGKLAGKLKAQEKRVIMAAADTFRAAAGEQLTVWAQRAGVEIIGGQEGADPASVLYDAIAAAKARKADVLLCDTAGRLHNKKNLMEELKKLNRILEREYPEAFRETLVVLDGTTGQNALSQAKQFAQIAEITGIILTKLDGTAKGGIAVAIQSELGIPVKYIGVGETIDDLQKFDSQEFVNALFDVSQEAASQEEE